jgi:hypothetical protein
VKGPDVKVIRFYTEKHMAGTTIFLTLLAGCGTAVLKTISPPANLITPVISWNSPASIRFGTALSSNQLDATANVSGTFVYVPSLGDTLAAGTHTLSATFVPTDSKTNAVTTATVSIQVMPATPVVTWAPPNPVSYGTVLSAAELDATSNVLGNFVYAPAVGSVLAPGPQLLRVVFTPTDAKDYTPVTANVTLNIAATPNNLFVATNGNDSWSCTLAAPDGLGGGPCATIYHARALIAKRIAQLGGAAQNYTVEIRGGSYYLSSPLIFGPADSVSSGHTVTYLAYPGETPVLSGGIPLTNWINNGGVWQTPLPQVSSGQWNFTQLWVNDTRRFRPMLPSPSTYYRAVSADSNSSFTFQPGDVSESWANLSDVEIVSMQAYTALISPIASINGNTVQLSDTTRGRNIAWGSRYRVENVKEAFGEPGQWYLDRPSGTLSYVPLPDEDMDSAVIVAPILTNLVIFSQGSTNITLSALTFAHTQWLPVVNEIGEVQDALGDDAAIMGIAASNITIDNCVVRNTGNGGIYFGPGTTHTTIQNSILGDIGGTGIAFSWISGSRSYPSIFGSYFTNPPNPPSVGPGLWSSYNSAINNLVEGVGRINPAGVGILLSSTNSYGTISHNEIFDTYQTGINVAWDLSQQDPGTSNNIVSMNLIYDIGQSVTSDIGGIYLSGLQPGTIVSNNIIHDVSGIDYGAWGLYLDSGATDITLQQNLVWNTSEGCFYSNPGENNLLQDNIFVNCNQITAAEEEARAVAPLDGWQQNTGGAIRAVDYSSDTRWFDGLAGSLFYTFQRNIVVWDSDDGLGYIVGPNRGGPDANLLQEDNNVFWNTGNSASNNGCIGGFTAITAAIGNCYWNTVGAQSYFTPSEQWKEWTRLGYDISSRWVNPNLTDGSTLYSTQVTSELPAGFQDWDHALAGRTSGVGGARGGTLPFPPPVSSYH